MKTLDLEERTSADLTDAIDQLHGLENAVRHQLLKWLVAYDRRRGWEQDGVATMADWICLRLGIVKARASEMIAVGHALEDLPVLARTYEAGLLSWDKLVLAVELAHTDSDAEVAADARIYSLHDLRHLVRQKRIISSQDAAEVHRGRSFRWWWEGDSWVAFGGRLPAYQGATVIKALSRIADHAAPGPDGIYEAYECRAADALADICGARIADDDPDKATVIVHIDAEVLAGADGVAELEDGGFVAAEVGRRLACGGRIQLVSHGPNGEILGQGA